MPEDFEHNRGNTISRTVFEKLGLEWTRLNSEYDRYVEQVIADPKIKFTEEQHAQFKAMQDQLWDIEVRLFQITKGELTIEVN